MYCVHCGAKAAGQYCGECGKPIVTPDAAEAASSGRPRRRMKSRLIRMAIYIAIMVLIFQFAAWKISTVLP